MVKADDGSVVVATPEETIQWALLPPRTLAGVAAFKAGLIGPVVNPYIGGVIDVRGPGGWGAALVCGVRRGGGVTTRAYGPALGPPVEVPAEETRKHSGPFVVSPDLSSGSEPVPVLCVNEQDDALMVCEDFKYSHVNIPTVRPPHYASLACLCVMLLRCGLPVTCAPVCVPVAFPGPHHRAARLLLCLRVCDGHGVSGVPSRPRVLCVHYPHADEQLPAAPAVHCPPLRCPRVGA